MPSEKESNSHERIPDPTTLTTQQLWREIAALKELVFTRLDSIEKAIIVAHDDMVRVPTEVQKAISTLKDLHEEKLHSISDLVTEKFRSIDQQFADRDARTLQAQRDNKVAIDAALAAAKESSGEQIRTQAMAIVKNETAAFKQIESLEDKINDTKDRLTRIEAMTLGSEKTVVTQHASGSYNTMLIGFAVSSVLGIAALVISLLRR